MRAFFHFPVNCKIKVRTTRGDKDVSSLSLRPPITAQFMISTKQAAFCSHDSRTRLIAVQVGVTRGVLSAVDREFELIDAPHKQHNFFFQIALMLSSGAKKKD
jgi:hypothetical protein